jgi:hypothetical protein
MAAYAIQRKAKRAETKECAQCGDVKPVGEFRMGVGRVTALSVWCKSCAGIDRESKVYEAQVGKARMQLAEVVEPAQARFLMLEQVLTKHVLKKSASQERIPKKFCSGQCVSSAARSKSC